MGDFEEHGGDDRAAARQLMRDVAEAQGDGRWDGEISVSSGLSSFNSHPAHPFPLEEPQLTIHPSMRQLQVGDRVKRARPGADWQDPCPHGIITETYLAKAAPAVKIRWGRLDNQDSTSVELVCNLVRVTEHVMQPDEVNARQLQAMAAKYGGRVVIEEAPVAAEG